MSRRRKIVLSAVILLSVGLFVFRDDLHTAYSACTKTPRNWIRSSSPMHGHLMYIWEHWYDDDVSESEAAHAMSAYVQSQLDRTSTTADLQLHIREHFAHPDFSPAAGAVPARAWKQRVRGYPPFFLDDYRVLCIRYFYRDGKFLYASLVMDRPKGTDLRTIHLTPPVDLFDLTPDPGVVQRPGGGSN